MRVGIFCFARLAHSLKSFKIVYAEALRKQEIAVSPLCMRQMLTEHCALHALFFGNCVHMQRVSALFQGEFVMCKSLAKAKKSS